MDTCEGYAGDYLTPAADRVSQLLETRYKGVFSATGATGAWLKEKQGGKSFAVNVASISRGGNLANPRIYEFDDRGFLSALTTAQSSAAK